MPRQEYYTYLHNFIVASLSASGHKRSASASLSGKTARELWLSAVHSSSERNRGGGFRGGRTTTEYWSDTLRRTGVGISTESRGSLSGLNKSQTQHMAYNSTSHYLRQMAGTEKAGGRKMNDGSSTSRPAPGTPAYKTAEEYYDDIIELKKVGTAGTFYLIVE